jgi:hypothetical protein
MTAAQTDGTKVFVMRVVFDWLDRVHEGEGISRSIQKRSTAPLIAVGGENRTREPFSLLNPA